MAPQHPNPSVLCWLFLFCVFWFCFCCCCRCCWGRVGWLVGWLLLGLQQTQQKKYKTKTRNIKLKLCFSVLGHLGGREIWQRTSQAETEKKKQNLDKTNFTNNLLCCFFLLSCFFCFSSLLSFFSPSLFSLLTCPKAMLNGVNLFKHREDRRKRKDRRKEKEGKEKQGMEKENNRRERRRNDENKKRVGKKRRREKERKTTRLNHPKGVDHKGKHFVNKRLFLQNGRGGGS